MARRRQWIVILGLAIALGWVGQQATEIPAAPQGGTQTGDQTPPTAPGVIRTEANLVIVDVIAQDKKENYIKDLDVKEFHVFEDEKEQPITTFSHSAEAKGLQEHPRYLVLFFDNSTMNPAEQTRARQAAAQFVEKAASAERMMAVVDFGGMFKELHGRCRGLEERRGGRQVRFLATQRAGPDHRGRSDGQTVYGPGPIRLRRTQRLACHS
jgi:hypothetical protein